MADVQQIAEAHWVCATLTTEIAARRRSGGSGKISAVVQEGSTVLTLPDRSTLAFAGSASLDQITFLGWDTTRPG